MLPKYEFGESVRVIRNLRNDGTYPGAPTGRLLVRRGSVGYVRDVGTFLQDQLIYTVDFIDLGVQVGCREQELQLETDHWIPTLFEFRDKVTPIMPLAVNGEVIASPGDIGEIEQVIKEHATGPAYHTRFNRRVLMVPETSLSLIKNEERNDE